MKISDYAFLSDCQSSALVNLDGSIDWFCAIRFDSPSVFARLLDPGAGNWRIAPAAPYTAARAYERDSLVLRTVFTTAEGEVELVDALALEPGARGHEIGLRSPHMLLRLVRGVSGRVEMEMDFAPRFEYGLTAGRIELEAGGLRARAGPLELRLSAPVALKRSSHGASAHFTVAAGEQAGFRLVCQTSPAGAAAREQEIAGAAEVSGAIDATVKSWQSWMEQHTGYQGLYLEQVRRSALVLQGLTYQPSGAVVAAATTSLPEVAGGSANWDYRFVWLRDASMMMNALWVAACPDEPQRFFDWINRASGRSGREQVQIMYGVEGERDLSERELGHLRGYGGSRPVRVGNEAWKQKQHDVTGEVLDAAYLLRDRLGEYFSASLRELLVSFADRAAASWREPDAGMWEARDRERHYLSSKVMCWVALDRAVRLAPRLDVVGEKVGGWSNERDAARREVLARGWNEQAGAYTGAFGSDRLDASVLLLPLVGFLPAGEPRMRATIAAVERELGSGETGLVRRWAEEPNGFIICSYWLVECLALAGEAERARELFQKVTALANDVGLLSEEAGAASGELLGNFPQAYSHVGLINAAWRLTKLEIE